MNPVILPQLPASFTQRDFVFIAANPRIDRIGRLKTFVSALDRRGKWIRITFEDPISESAIPDKMTLALTMEGTAHTSWQNVIKVAERVGACAPNHLFKTAEITNVLGILASRRMEGDGSGTPPASEVEPEEDNGKPSLPEVTRTRNEIDSAIAMLEMVRANLEPALISFLIATDHLEALCLENEELRQRLAAAEQRTSDLEKRLQVMRGFKKERDALRTLLRIKESEIGKMEVTFSQVEAALRTFRR